MKNRKNIVLQAVLWIVQGFLVGLGAILPGVSGGTLCYAFGIYDQLLEVLSSPIKGIKRHWLMLLFVALGGGIGFVGFAGVTEALLNWDEPVVLCVFVGLIIGTLPELWRDSGAKGRSRASFVALGVSFLAIGALFLCCEHLWSITIPANIWGFAVCGVVWGLSFIVPGFSSSTLLLFFGIYTAMAGGIKSLDFAVLLPLGITMLATLLLLSKVMRLVFDRYHSVASHSVLGFVLATTLLILPSFKTTWQRVLLYIACIVAGAVASFFLTVLFDRIKRVTKEEGNAPNADEAAAPTAEPNDVK